MVVNDVDIPDIVVDDDDVLKNMIATKPTIDTKLLNFIVIDNIPKIDSLLLEKFKLVLSKILSKCGTVVSMDFPMEHGCTRGFVFVEFKFYKEAQAAVSSTNRYRLDKIHTLYSFFLNEDENKKILSSSNLELKKSPFIRPGNLYSWLKDEDFREQIVSVYDGGDIVKVDWFNGYELESILSRECFTSGHVGWSPKGTYLSTIHKQGVMLWMDNAFIKSKKFKHPSANKFSFSPNENFLVSYNENLHSNEHLNNLVVWDIVTSESRCFFSVDKLSEWPYIKWSSDERLFSMEYDDLVKIYETEEFTLKRTINNIKNFTWSTKGCLAVYWQSKFNDTPAKVTIEDIKNNNIVRVKLLYNVVNCKLYWQSNSDYLCIQVERMVKKTSLFNLEIFIIKEKEIPVETIEIKEYIKSFFWEPNGDSFVVFSDKFLLYKINQLNISKSKIIEKKRYTNVHWCSNGQFFVLSSLKEQECYFEFWDAYEGSMLTKQEHAFASDCSWDFSGRYFLSYISNYYEKKDNEVVIFSIVGDELFRLQYDGLCQVLFRPRPLLSLDIEQIKNIKKNYKKFQNIFDNKERVLALKNKEKNLQLIKNNESIKQIRDSNKDLIQKIISYRESCIRSFV